MALPLSLHHDEDRSVLLSDSEDDDLLPAPRKVRGPPRAHSRDGEELIRKKTKEAAANIPTHPIPAMQPAFAESLVEATQNVAPKPKLRFASARDRRNYLLDAEKGAELHNELWRHRPGQKYHELWKLMAQISFGVYLMLNGIANSNEQVVSILQRHIDEVDEFLEISLEDINLAIKDLRERLDILKLPMENIRTFEQMLEDRTFRLKIVTGNEKIEHIISRTTAVLEATIEDVGEGLGATKEFAMYLSDQQDRTWRQQRPAVVEIFDAMRGNAQGWYKAFVEMQEKTSTLRALLNKLEQMVSEMNYRAGEVSRRTRTSIAPFSSPFSSPEQQLSPKVSSSRSSTFSFGRHPPGLVLSKSMSQLSMSGSNATKETLIVQFAAPMELTEPVELEANSIPKTIVTVEEDSEDSEDSDDSEDLESDHESGKAEPAVDEGLFILQPRTYTPQPPAPIPSPRLQDPPTPDREERPTKRTSLRQRLSEKGNNLPEAIQVPIRATPVLQRPKTSAAHQQSPRQPVPRVYQAPDSAYGSDNETRLPGRSMTDVGVVTIANMPPPVFPAATIPSPLSDQQHYFPVRASPHSPLQQRPWTSATNAPPDQMRNQPSAMGMSTLSNMTTLSPESNQKLKKKRSAFGWLKKAFSLDEEERAEFEARRAQQTPNPYYEARSPRFVDGRRRPESRRQQ